MKIFKAESKDDCSPIAHSAAGSYIHSGAIANEVFGKDFSYGNLFAYMVRRFGYPTYGTDSYKRLACWYLTTPVKGAWLRVDISANSEASLHFGEAYNEIIYKALNEVDNDHWDAHRKAVNEAAAQDGVVIVSKFLDEGPEYINAYNKWEAIHYPQYINIDTASLRPAETMKLFREFEDYENQLWQKYRVTVDRLKLSPLPGYIMHKDYTFTYHHPLYVELAKAMKATLIDLLRPTYVRDISINANGHFECSRICTALMSEEEAEQYSCEFTAEPWKYSGYGVNTKYFETIKKERGQ